MSSRKQTRLARKPRFGSLAALISVAFTTFVEITDGEFCTHIVGDHIVGDPIATPDTEKEVRPSSLPFPLPFPLPARLPPLFDLGRVVATSATLEALRDVATDASELLHRHQRGDWGDMCVEDRELNRKAVVLGYRLLSCYVLPDTKEKVWIITEADRSATTLLLPSEY